MLLDNPTARREPAHQSVDRLGALASSACAAHCVISAFLPQALAAVGLGILLGHEAEWGLTLVALCFAAAALYLGWRKHHSALVATTLGLGSVALLLARVLEDSIAEPAGIALSVLAGAALVFGHFSSIRASRRAQASVA